ncbi:MAG: DUF1489 domain-containing protein [Roseovarius sp.]|nr:DUF1489 domain-containing protein [Roseovarius sp.]MCY4209119.1 DUF1489 domain-containing protein [Roseovarius sp.]MCY4292165.1 DUF1489 domain-containing protein [Roseovarius sp.]MCY4314885.1 DUF1489 domain-containing protein [Roseovarius sp.]
MTSGNLNLIKLSVGTESVEGLVGWQKTKKAQSADGYPQHVTRMWPVRENALLDGGSIYWVIKGHICCRQRIIRFDATTHEDGIKRCAIVMDPTIIRTSSVIKRPFQGWRYLEIKDAPADLSNPNHSETGFPEHLSATLNNMGIL